ncbi:MAG: FAD-dependent oxidoreductase, partial [Thermoleophilaceae bacterium]
MVRRVVIVGGGVAAMRCALELRTLGFDGGVTVVAREETQPYDRTLVSKDLLAEEPVPDSILLLNPSEAYAEAAIALRTATAATGLDLAARRIEVDTGRAVPFDRLVIATGGEAIRPMPLMADGVIVLRDRVDAARLRERLDGAEHVAIVGGGFIGTEVASAAVARGLRATIVTPQPAPLASALGPQVAERVAALHRLQGVELATG